MKNPELVHPCHLYKDSFLSGMRDTEEEAYYGDQPFDKIENDFDWFIDFWEDARHGRNLQGGWVPNSHFWIIDEGEFVGRIDIRHRLNDNLKKFGGHVGYEIRISKRKQGYGPWAMQAILPECKKLGLDKILVTCSDTNIPSMKIIEKSGGVLHDKVQNDFLDVPTRRYWITIP